MAHEFELLQAAAKLVEFMEDFEVLFRDMPGKHQHGSDEVVAALTSSLEDVAEMMGPAFAEAREHFKLCADQQCALLLGTDATGPNAEQWTKIRQAALAASTSRGLQRCIDIMVGACKACAVEHPAQITRHQIHLQAAGAWMALAAAVDDLATYDARPGDANKDSGHLSKLVGEARKASHAFDKAFGNAFEEEDSVCVLSLYVCDVAFTYVAQMLFLNCLFGMIHDLRASAHKLQVRTCVDRTLKVWLHARASEHLQPLKEDFFKDVLSHHLKEAAMTNFHSHV